MCALALRLRAALRVSDASDEPPATPRCRRLVVREREDTPAPPAPATLPTTRRGPAPHQGAARTVAPRPLKHTAVADRRRHRSGMPHLRSGDGAPSRGAWARHGKGPRWTRARRAGAACASRSGRQSLKRSGVRDGGGGLRLQGRGAPRMRRSGGYYIGLRPPRRPPGDPEAAIRGVWEQLDAAAKALMFPIPRPGGQGVAPEPG